MRSAVMARVAGDGDGVDLVAMVAAVADYTPVGGAREAKLLRDRDELVLTLRPNARHPGRPGALARGPAPARCWSASRRRWATRSPARGRSSGASRSTSSSPTTSRGPGPGSAATRTSPPSISETEAEEVPLGSKRELARVLLDRVEPRLAPRGSRAEGAT